MDPLRRRRHRAPPRAHAAHRPRVPRRPRRGRRRHALRPAERATRRLHHRAQPVASQAVGQGQYQGIARRPRALVPVARLVPPRPAGRAAAPAAALPQGDARRGQARLAALHGRRDDRLPLPAAEALRHRGGRRALRRLAQGHQRLVLPPVHLHAARDEPAARGRRLLEHAPAPRPRLVLLRAGGEHGRQERLVPARLWRLRGRHRRPSSAPASGR